MIDAPLPTLAYEGSDTGIAALEMPVDVFVGAVTDDETIIGPEGLSTFAFFVYRRLTSGAAFDIWDDGAMVWTSEEDVGIERKPTQLAYEADKPVPWHGIIVGAGGKDANGQAQFEKASAGYPQYSVRGFFITKDGSEAMLTGSSPNVTFAGTSDKNLMVMGPGEDEELDAATQARLLLKDTSLNEIGGLLVERDAPGARVTVSNAAGASIVLQPDGSIDITPAGGRFVRINGDLEAARITYQPGGGGAKQVLT